MSVAAKNRARERIGAPDQTSVQWRWMPSEVSARARVEDRAFGLVNWVPIVACNGSCNADYRPTSDQGLRVLRRRRIAWSIAPGSATQRRALSVGGTSACANRVGCTRSSIVAIVSPRVYSNVFCWYHQATRSITLIPADGSGPEPRSPRRAKRSAHQDCGFSLRWPVPPCPGSQPRTRPHRTVTERPDESSALSAGRCSATSSETASPNRRSISSGRVRSTLRICPRSIRDGVGLAAIETEHVGHSIVDELTEPVAGTTTDVND